MTEWEITLMTTKTVAGETPEAAFEQMVRDLNARIRAGESVMWEAQIILDDAETQ